MNIKPIFIATVILLLLFISPAIFITTSPAQPLPVGFTTSSSGKQMPSPGLMYLASADVEQWTSNNRRRARIAILMASDKREETHAGFREQMSTHAQELGGEQEMIVRNAGGDRSKLSSLAAELISTRPDIAIACGGIEADALKVATEGTNIPVVFLAAASTVNRGLVASMNKPGGNITGIDTNDTALIEKRLWYLRKMLPEAKTVQIFHMPDNSPSVDSVALAKKIAPRLGLELKIVAVKDSKEIEQAAKALKRSEVDAIQLLPVALIDVAVKEVLLPRAMAEKIPIMGYNEESLKRGAFASYGSSRRACGGQAARLAIKILHGAKPQNLPVETPEELTLMINRRIVEALDLSLPDQLWRLADVTDFTP